MRSLFKLIAVFVSVPTILAVSARAQDTGNFSDAPSPAPSLETGDAIDETPELWFVELSGRPAADGGSMTSLLREKQAFRFAARKARLRYTERYAFNTLWNGFSVRISRSDVGALWRVPGVKAIYPVETIAIPTTSPMDYPELATALAMTGADIAQNTLGYTGAGVRVAVMDTGIDYDHADLGGDGMQRSNSTMFPTGRVVAGWDFVGDAFNADPTSMTFNPVPVPDPYPDDCNGHGTHVSGIVGANGAVKGVAPNVVFGAYRVFGCEGSTTADIMIAAMERALADNMDVLNMSIGSAFQWPQHPTAQAADRLVNKGMVVVASIGNNGTAGVYSAGSPGIGKKVIGVASFDNSHVALTTFTITPDDTAIGYGNAAAAPTAPTSGTFEMARTGTATTTNDACSPLPAGSLAGKVVLIRRGTCTFHTKSLNAMNAGAAAVVLYNNVAGRFSPTVAGTPAITIPVVAVSDTEGVLINNRLASGPVNMTWTSQTGIFLNPTGNLISSFSSYGQTADLNIKPDIGAPGGLIRSTYPLESGAYTTISGTSMAAPHTAGGAALVLQAHPRTPSQQMRNILQNSADPRVWAGNPGLGFLDNVHRQGAGMLDIPGAILAMTRIEPGKLALGESEAGPSTQRLWIENKSSSPVTYDLSHVRALSTGGSTFAPTFHTSDASASFSANPVAVPAGGSTSVDVTITPATGPNRAQYGGYIVFTPQGGGAVYRVPYAGFVGDYQSIVALAPTANGFPWLARLVGNSFTNQPAGATYTLMGGNVPYILFHMDHQARRVEMTVRDAVTGRSWQRALRQDYFPRNSTATGFFAFAWDGRTVRGKKLVTVPDGDYIIELKVLKALGDDSNPAHIEMWTSPVITIDRP